MKYLFLTFFVATLSGCWFTNPNTHLPWEVSPLGIWGAGEAVSVLTTGKAIESHIAGAITGKDCSVERIFTGKGKFCMTQIELMRMNTPYRSLEPVYCYRTLAAPACYAAPSPNPSDILIGVYEKPVYR